ncbi:MAG: PEP-CTERM sorting domain-containing protein [Pirellulales bacterium]|nr:PEP-CTERM sorting domain-containing protein [Pirellulales bacterium]
MFQQNAALVLILLVGICSTGDLAAAPTYWLANGHYYERIDDANVTWNDAYADVASRSWLGVQGHLMTITSSAEQNFLANNSLLPPSGKYWWFGGYQPPSSPEPAGNWQWVTGETWSYANWASGEPNNAWSGEDRLQLRPDGKWNDLGQNWSQDTGGYYVEYPVPDYPAQVAQYVFTPVTGPAINRLGKWNGTSFEAVGPGSITSGNVHVLVHGWAPGTTQEIEDAKNGTPAWDTWVGDKWKELADTIASKDPGSTVLMFSWVDMSATEDSPLCAYKSQAKVNTAGGLLASALEQACDFSSASLKMQVIGHSHGAAVAAKAGLELAKDGNAIQQLTFLDSPENGLIPSGPRNMMSDYIGSTTVLGQQILDGTTFVDNYYACAGISHGDIEVSVELDSPYESYNITNPLDFSMFSKHHNYPLEWYTNATQAMTWEDGVALYWSPLLGNQYIDLETSYEQAWHNPLTGEFIPTLEYSLISGSGDVIGIPDTLYRDLRAESLYAEGTVVIDADNFEATLTENSPACWHSVIVVDENDVCLEFAYQFLEVGDGDELGIWIDGELRYLAVGTITGTDLETGCIDISYLDPGTHLLSIALHSTGEAGCSFRVSDFQMVSEVPEPSVVVLLIAGFMSIMGLRRK